MDAMATPEAIDRLQRFAAYVEQDAGNADLLAHAWEAAMEAGEHATAVGYAAAGERCDANGRAAWLQRQAQGLLAANRPREAAAVLERARACGMPGIVADHDLACIALKEGDHRRCVDILQPWMDAQGGASPDHIHHVQAQWLRAMHRLQRITPAWEWVQARERRGRGLDPVAAAPASLLAIDADRFEDARVLADRALAGNERAVEALTARGCVALAEGDVAAASSWLQAAQALQPADGRIQSALGLVALQAGLFTDARRRFEAAVQALPSHVGSWHGLGWSWLLQGDAAQAADTFQQAVDLDPNFGESHGAVGLALVLQGRRDEAVPHLRCAHKLDARNVTASFAQALESGRLSPAQFTALAQRLLDRPGFFGEKLSARWSSGAAQVDSLG